MRPEPIEGVQYLKTDDPELIAKADRHQVEVFAEYGYPGEGSQIEEVAQWPSIYFVAIAEGVVVGCIRVVTKSDLEFPTLSMMELWPDWAERAKSIAQNSYTEEILFSTVRKGWRTRGNASVILNLYRVFVQDATERGVEYWLTTIDEKLFPYFTGIFNFKFEQIGDTQELLGAPCVPTIMKVERGLEQLKENDIELWEFIMS